MIKIPFFKLSNSMQARISLIIICVTLFLFAIFGVFSANMQSNQLSFNLKENSQTISKMLASSVESHILTDDLSEVEQTLLYGIKLQNANKIYIFDSNGAFMFGAAKDKHSNVKLVFTPDEFAKLSSKKQTYIEEGDKIVIIEAIQPQSPCGFIKVEFNRDDVNEIRTILTRNIIVFGIVSLFVSIGLITIVFKPITANIHTLADFAQELDTNAGIHIEISSRYHEIELLADSLNTASTKLYAKECEIAHQHEELQELNDSLKMRVNEAVEDIREKDRMMFQQARLASMGEMIGNIAHQWRQPLNHISISIQDMKYEYEYEKSLSKEYIEETVDSVMKQVRYMSKTIDDFRNFFKPDKTKSEFSVDCQVEKAIEFVKPSLTSHNIEIEVIKHNPYEVRANGHENEYVQVIMNLLSNAKDASVANNIKEPKICIEIAKYENRSVVKISDNAGGIPHDVLHKIFDPYFTTKGPQEGTGIGLYMAKMIIEKNMNGKLEVTNNKEGAEFTIVV